MQQVEFFGRAVRIAVVYRVFTLEHAALRSAWQYHQRHAVAQASGKWREALHCKRGTAKHCLVHRAAWAVALAIRAGQGGGGAAFAAIVTAGADIDVQPIARAKSDFFEWVPAVVRQVVKYGFALDGASGRRYRRAPDLPRLANIGLAVWAKREARGAVQATGQYPQLRAAWHRASCGQCHLQQAAMARLPRTHVQKPEAARRYFEDAARRTQPFRLVSQQGYAGARRACDGQPGIVAAVALGSVAACGRQQGHEQSGNGGGTSLPDHGADP